MVPEINPEGQRGIPMDGSTRRSAQPLQTRYDIEQDFQKFWRSKTSSFSAPFDTSILKASNLSELETKSSIISFCHDPSTPLTNDAWSIGEFSEIKPMRSKRRHSAIETMSTNFDTLIPKPDDKLSDKEISLGKSLR